MATVAQHSTVSRSNAHVELHSTVSLPPLPQTSEDMSNTASAPTQASAPSNGSTSPLNRTTSEKTILKHDGNNEIVIATPTKVLILCFYTH